MMVVSGLLPNILSLVLFLTSHVVSSWCSSQKLHQLRGMIALGWKLFSIGFLKGGAEEDEAPGVREETVPFRSNIIIRLFISCTSYKRENMLVYLVDSPWGRPVLSSCSSYSKKVCRVEPRLSMDFSSSL